MAKLILTRHGQSLWNAENKFTGWVDVPLSEMGRAEATIASCKLKDYRVRVCFTITFIVNLLFLIGSELYCCP